MKSERRGKAMKKVKRFYDEGIRFECQGEGKCCLSRGRYSYVYLSFGDRKRLAAHFGMSVEAFTKAYARRTDGLVHLDYPEKDCPFFKENRCDVYEARPWQCRTWPFWPENMRRDVWEREVATYCPGIGKGRLYTAEEIEEILSKRKDVEGCRGTG
ncbi:MAG TPA: YkgJ family cysteine cluster protein [Dehalococcoidia bacterium]|nr:YkgJ family cysteine cluster protein [Dehalococcoidia bacterium]